MRPEAALADRNLAVREAARAWKEAGIVDDAKRKEIEALFLDDRVRVGPVFRLLLFVFTLIGVLAAGGTVFAIFATAFRADGAGPYAFACLPLGLALLALTEFQTGTMKRAQGGTEAATSFAALSFLLGGAGLFLFGVLDVRAEAGLPPFLLLGAAALLAAAWRWGYPLYSAFATAALLAAIAFLPASISPETAPPLVAGVRAAWILLALAGAAFLPKVADSRGLPPSQRRIATAALLVLLAGLYLAVDLSSFSGYWIEAFSLLRFGGSPPPPPPSPLRYLSMAMTVLVPAAIVAWGLLARRRPVLLLGLLLAGCAGVSLRRHLHVAPLWVVLSVGGFALLALALLARRHLESGESGERDGFTADPPLEGKDHTRLLELIAVTATLTPATQAPAEPVYQGKGGEFGGAGSNSEF